MANSTGSQGLLGQRMDPRTHPQTGSNLEKQDPRENEEFVVGLPPIIPIPIFDELTLLLCNFIYTKVTSSNIELEAKLGRIIDPRSNNRIALPVSNEACISSIHPGMEYKFESAVSQKHFMFFKTVLNEMYARSQVNTTGATKIWYNTSEQTDIFCKTSRITYEKDKVTRCLRKTRLGDLDVFSPNSSLDFRISAKREVETELPQNTVWHLERRKQRISYMYSIWRIDITVVVESYPGKGKRKRRNQPKYEAEIECCNMNYLVQERDKAAKNIDNKLLAISRAFLENIHCLTAALKRIEHESM